jgi:hypothetical protein
MSEGKPQISPQMKKLLNRLLALAKEKTGAGGGK